MDDIGPEASHKSGPNHKSGPDFGSFFRKVGVGILAVGLGILIAGLAALLVGSVLGGLLGGIGGLINPTVGLVGLGIGVAVGVAVGVGVASWIAVQMYTSLSQPAPPKVHQDMGPPPNNEAKLGALRAKIKQDPSLSKPSPTVAATNEAGIQTVAVKTEKRPPAGLPEKPRKGPL